MAEYEARLREKFAAYQDVIERLCTIPTVDPITAWTILAEMGTDLSQFPSADDLCRWAGLCPGNTRVRANASAGGHARGIDISAELWCRTPGQRRT